MPSPSSRAIFFGIAALLALFLVIYVVFYKDSYPYLHGKGYKYEGPTREEEEELVRMFQMEIFKGEDWGRIDREVFPVFP